MLSRIISSVRGVLPGQTDPPTSSSPPAQPEIIRELRGRKIATPSPQRAKKMVATRRQSVLALEPETPSVQLRTERAAKAAKSAESTPTATRRETPTSSSRKRRKISGTQEELTDATNVTPKSSSRRSKRVAQRESREGTEESEQSHTHFEKSMPLSSLSQEVLQDESDGEKLDSKTIRPTKKPETETEAEKPEKKMEKLFEAVIVPAMPPAQVSTPAKKGKGKAAKRSKAEDFFAKEASTVGPQKDERTEEAVTELIEEAKAVAPVNKRKRFGSEEPIEEIAPQPQPAVEAEIAHVEDAQEDSDESSDDEAPEAVTTTAAQEQVRKAEHEAAKAAEKQVSLARQKRKEKDAQLKSQAATSTKRQKVASTAPSSPSDSDASDDDIMLELDHKLIAEDTTNTTSRSRLPFDRENLPTYLPDAYLSDSPPPSLTQRQTHLSKPNKIKFLEEPKVKDVRVGNAKVRVAKKEVEGLAPKVNKRARNLKEEWLSGRVNGKDGRLLGGGVRKKENVGGFFVKKR